MSEQADGPALDVRHAGLDLTARRRETRRQAALADFVAEYGERRLRVLGGRRTALRWLGDRDPALDAPALVRLREHRLGW